MKLCRIHRISQQKEKLKWELRHSHKIPKRKTLGSKGALLYGVNPVCVFCKANRLDNRESGLFSVAELPNKGLHPVHRFAAILKT